MTTERCVCCMCVLLIFFFMAVEGSLHTLYTQNSVTVANLIVLFPSWCHNCIFIGLFQYSTLLASSRSWGHVKTSRSCECVKLLLWFLFCFVFIKWIPGSEIMLCVDTITMNKVFYKVMDVVASFKHWEHRGQIHFFFFYKRFIYFF